MTLSSTTVCRRKVLESSPELRQFEEKLRAAYVRKEQSAQLAAKELQKVQEKVNINNHFQISC